MDNPQKHKALFECYSLILNNLVILKDSKDKMARLNAADSINKMLSVLKRDFEGPPFNKVNPDISELQVLGFINLIAEKLEENRRAA